MDMEQVKPWQKLTEPAENGIVYTWIVSCCIAPTNRSLSDKPNDEQALRLRLFRPTPVMDRKAYDKATVPASKAYDRGEGC
jgi:hypothetical protein